MSEILFYFSSVQLQVLIGLGTKPFTQTKMFFK
uniref:Uncharacterized protein n=1 Tax=Rhizophora mucronata TaxID=61149 RepID=A0A2P2Q1C9_RHIMU